MSETQINQQPGTAYLYTCPEGGFAHGYASEPFTCTGDHHLPTEAVGVVVVQKGDGRSGSEIREWVTERRDYEQRNAPSPQHGNTPAAGMTMGAIETLDALTAYLDGDDDA